MPEDPDSGKLGGAPKAKPGKAARTTRGTRTSERQRGAPARAARRPRSSDAERVSSILTAAEDTAERIRKEAEDRVRERIAEGQRAADNRVRAAEEEAAEILASARVEAERLRRDRSRGGRAGQDNGATSEALTIVANAQQNADETLEQATEAAAQEPARGGALLA